MKKILLFLSLVCITTLGMAQSGKVENSEESQSNSNSASMHIRINKQQLTPEEIAKRKEDRQQREIGEESTSGMQINRRTAIRQNPETERDQSLRERKRAADTSGRVLKVNSRILSD